MRNFKKVIAGALALLMLALSVNVSFAAESYTEKEAIVVAKVNGSGIMTGTDKGFEPSKSLTRAEAAAIMVRMKGISEDTVKQNAGATLFTDVAASHWAAGYVNVASNYNLIKGVGANKFAPEKEVTVAEFYTMAIRALGAGQLVESEGTWPTNYVNFAIENDLAEDVAQIYTATSTRMTAATIVANTLKANMWVKATVKSNGEITWGEADKTILTDILKIEEVKNVSFTDISAKDNEAKLKDALKWTSGKVIDFNKRANISSAKLGQTYTVWYDKEEDEVIAFWVPDDSESIVFTNIKDVTATEIKLVVDGKETKYKWATETAQVKNVISVNGAVDDGAQTPTALTYTDIPSSTDTLPVFGVAYLNDEGKVNKIYTEQYAKYGVVKEVKNNKIKFESSTDVKGSCGGVITIDLEDDDKVEYLVTKDGKSISVEDIEEDDVVFYYTYSPKTDYTTYVMDVYNNSVEGKVKSVSGKNFTVDGTSYKAMNNTVAGFYKAGDEGTFYFNQDNKAVMFVKEKAAKGDLAVVAAQRTSTDKYGTDKTLEVKLALLDGTKTDWMEVDVFKSAKEQNYAVKYTDNKYYLDVNHDGRLTDDDDSQDDDAFDPSDATVLTKNDAVTYYSTGAYAMAKLVNYKLSGDTVVFTKVADEKGAYVLNATSFSDKEQKDIVAAGSPSKNYVVNSNAKVFELKDNDETGYKYEYSLKAINLDDLDNINSGLGQIADIDYDDLSCGIIIIAKDASNIKTERKWAYILKTSSYSDDDDADLDEEYEVVYAGETSKVTLHADGKNLQKGDVVELTVEDGVITNTKSILNAAPGDKTQVKAPSAATKYLFLNKVFGNGDAGIIEVAVGSDLDDLGDTIAINRVAVAEDVIVIKNDKKDGTGDNSISNFDSIQLLDNAKANTNELVAGDLEKGRILSYILYTDKDASVEPYIIAITYTDKALN